MTEPRSLRPGSLLALLAVFAGACGGPEVPEVGTEGMEPAVREAIHDARDALAADRGSAAAWGRFGMVLHAHRLGGPASVAYTEAARLDTDDHRWPHLHGRLLETAEPPRALDLADEALHRNSSAISDWPSASPGSRFCWAAISVSSPRPPSAPC